MYFVAELVLVNKYADYKKSGETRVHYSVTRQGRLSILKTQRKQTHINNMENKQ